MVQQDDTVGVGRIRVRQVITLGVPEVVFVGNEVFLWVVIVVDPRLAGVEVWW